MATCEGAWHRVGNAQSPTFVRFAQRMADENGTYIYRIGPRPDDAECRTIWCYGDNGKPWKCIACRQPIDGPKYRPPSAMD